MVVHSSWKMDSLVTATIIQWHLFPLLALYAWPISLGRCLFAVIDRYTHLLQVVYVQVCWWALHTTAIRWVQCVTTRRTVTGRGHLLSRNSFTTVLNTLWDVTARWIESIVSAPTTRTRLALISLQCPLYNMKEDSSEVCTELWSGRECGLLQLWMSGAL